MRQDGFTLIELMIVICIIGVLSAIASPKLANTIRASQEARTKGNLAILRGAIVSYTADQGRPPTDDLTSLTVVGTFINEIPLKYTPPYHPEGRSVSAGPLSAQADSRGDWFYVNDPNSPSFGSVMVNCVHKDLKGTVWTSL